MKTKQRIDKVLESVTKKIEEEVTALIGAVLTLSESENTLISKEDFFDQPLGKQVSAKLDITGEIEGAGCLLVRVKDAIRLGGTLIMLPQNELDETIANEEYNEETKDSFGEIANIIAGSYTKVFEEMYPEACRFIRKEQEILIPAKVDIASEIPVPNQLLYQISSKMKLDDKDMGEMTVLLPAAAFGLEGQTDEKKSTEPAENTSQYQEQSVEKSGEVIEEQEEHVESAEITEPEKKKGTAGFDVGKHRKRVDALLSECRVRIEEEVSALLGVEVQLNDFENRRISKEQYFLDEVSGKQILAHMKVTGEREDKSYLLVSLKDAIRIGGILIMLPPAELDAAIAEDDFSDDAQDAYGEIANIIAGVYSGFFEESYTKSLHFVRTELEQVVPLTVDTVSEEPMPDQGYYLSSSSLVIEGKTYGKIHMLFPLSLLELEGLGEEEVEGKRPATITAAKDVSKPSRPVTTQEEAYEEKKGVDILLVSDDALEMEKISTVLQRSGYSIKTLSFKNNINNHISSQLKAVFLVMHEVNEQAFGVAIKVSSSCSVPLIAAGPAWTRTKVIKAVKYGVDDILLTPASEQDIQEKIDSNLVKLAA